MGDEIEVQLIDYSNYYMIYGVIVMVVTLLLFWFFVKVNIGGYEKQSEQEEPQSEQVEQRPKMRPRPSYVATQLASLGKEKSNQDASALASAVKKQNDAALSIIDELSGTNNEYQEASYVRTDSTYSKKLPLGEYGGVPVYFNTYEDDDYASQWRGVDQGIYVENSKKTWQRSNHLDIID